MSAMPQYLAARRYFCLSTTSYLPVRTSALARDRAPRIRNSAIPHNEVYLVDPVTSKPQPHPTQLDALLRSINLNAFSIELVEDNPRPIVRFSSSGQQDRGTTSGRLKALEPKTAASSISFLRNSNIPYRHVHVVDQASGSLSEKPEKIEDVLAGLKRGEENIQLVAISPVPIVKVISRSDEYRKRKAQHQDRRARAQASKEVHCSWSLAPSDLERKFSKAAEELERGHAVQLVFSPKKGALVPLPKARQLMLQQAMNILGPISQEAAPRMAEGLRVSLHFQPLVRQRHNLQEN